MAHDPLPDLLEKLSQGDMAAAQEVFCACEPYLRKVVRRRLSAPMRAKFDSLDIVQSVWAGMLDGFRERRWHFADADHLRAFLAQAVCNRFIDRVRRHQRAAAHEQPAGDAELAGQCPAADPRPSEVAQADDLWQHMLQLCPPEHHELLRLRREGLSLGELAARTGLHPDSIRRILRTLARQLAARQAPLLCSDSQ